MQWFKSKPHHLTKISGINKQLKTCAGGNFLVYPFHLVDTQHQITGEAYDKHYQTHFTLDRSTMTRTTRPILKIFHVQFLTSGDCHSLSNNCTCKICSLACKSRQGKDQFKPPQLIFWRRLFYFVFLHLQSFRLKYTAFKKSHNLFLNIPRLFTRNRWHIPTMFGFEIPINSHRSASHSGLHSNMQ